MGAVEGIENKANSVQLKLQLPTGTELGNKKCKPFHFIVLKENNFDRRNNKKFVWSRRWLLVVAQAVIWYWKTARILTIRLCVTLKQFTFVIIVICYTQ